MIHQIKNLKNTEIYPDIQTFRQKTRNNKNGGKLKMNGGLNVGITASTKLTNNSRGFLEMTQVIKACLYLRFRDYVDGRLEATQKLNSLGCLGVFQKSDLGFH